jgi:hypothetical protein
MGPTLFEAPPALSAQELCLILKRDLTSFIERSFYELHPGHRLDLAPHIEVIATRLEAVRHGEIRRLIINLPPRHLKSHCVSVAFIAWLLGHHPAKHVICASYGQDLADDFAAECQRVMRSPFYRFLFGDVLGARQAGNDFETVGGGRRLATSVGGVLTGRGADIIVLDDPQKADDVLSETTRKATHTWFDNTLLSRLNDKLQGSIIIVMQRLHQDDLVGHSNRGTGTSYPYRRLPRSMNAISSTDRLADVSSGECRATHCIRHAKARNPWRTRDAQSQNSFLRANISKIRSRWNGLTPSMPSASVDFPRPIAQTTN